jgi:hypothetical protein
MDLIHDPGPMSDLLFSVFIKRFKAFANVIILNQRMMIEPGAAAIIFASPAAKPIVFRGGIVLTVHSIVQCPELRQEGQKDLTVCSSLFTNRHRVHSMVSSSGKVFSVQVSAKRPISERPKNPDTCTPKTGIILKVTQFAVHIKDLHMDGHHLIFGELKDYITGETLKDTHDERYRQKLARILVEEKGYPKSEVTPRVGVFTRAGEKCAIIPIDYQVMHENRICMIIKYGPGSMVTRRRPALAASRLMAPYQIPVVVVTNGETAEILNGAGGEVSAIGFAGIPPRQELADQFSSFQFLPISTHRAEMESRILYAYDVDDSCPCDDTICRL